MIGESVGLDVILSEPSLGFFASGDQGVDAKEYRGFLIEGGELGFPEIAEFGVAELVDPIGDGLADSAGLIGEQRLVGENFIGGSAVVRVPLGKLVAHEQPLGGEEGVGFLGIDEEGEGAAPAGGFEQRLGDEGTIAFAPFWVLFKSGGKLVIEDAVIDQDRFRNVEGGGAEVAMQFHKKFKFQSSSHKDELMMREGDGCRWKRVFASFFVTGREEFMEKRREMARFLQHLRMGEGWIGWQRKDYLG